MSIIYSERDYIKQFNITDIYDEIKKVSFQRDLDTSRINEIKDYLQKKQYISEGSTDITYPLLGIITLGVFNEKYYCIDGQHRLNAYYSLVSDKNQVKIIVHIIKVDSFVELRDKFKQINQSVQVPDYLLYEENNDTQLKIKEAVRNITTIFRSFFVKQTTSTRRVYRPRMRQSELEDNLFHSKLINDMSSDQIINYIMSINDKLNTLDSNQIYDILSNFKETSYTDNKTKISNFIIKAKSNKPVLLLGLFPKYTWLDEGFQSHINTFLTKGSFA